MYFALTQQVYVRVYLVFEREHAQLCVRRFVERTRPDAAAMLVGRQAQVALLLVPQMKDTRIRRPDHHHLTLDVLPVQIHVLQSPSRDLLVESLDLDEVRPILARHAVAEVAPESGVLRYDELVFLGRDRHVLQGVHDARVIQAEDDRVVHAAPLLCVQPASLEEVRREDDVDVAQEHEHVASRPALRADLQTTTAREVLV